MAQKPIEIGDLLCDPSGDKVTYKGNRLRIFKSKVKVLYLLMANAGHVVNEEAFMKLLYSEREALPGSKNVDIFICHLRKRLSAVSPDGSNPIETVPGKGYKFLLPAGDVAIAS